MFRERVEIEVVELSRRAGQKKMEIGCSERDSWRRRRLVGRGQNDACEEGGGRGR